ncbi:MAG: RNA polymerase sigma factor [Bacteroidota bacterium]|nr:RNA polymerase sigma factor [Bacteroidota bacterium]MDP4287240.1 RNA polymerase sigma factor [Bacteroidota bacterium]
MEQASMAIGEERESHAEDQSPRGGLAAGLPLRTKGQDSRANRDQENAEDLALFREFLAGMGSALPEGRRQAREAYTKIYLRYRDRVYAYSLRMLSSQEEAQDLYQEVFLRVLTRAQTFEEEKSLGGWIFTIAHNLCLNKLRDRKPHDTIDDMRPGLGASPHDPLVVRPPEDLGESWRDRIEWAMAQLPAEQREALVLREYEGLSHQEITEVLHASIPAIKSRIYRAKESLRVLLGPYYNETI